MLPTPIAISKISYYRAKILKKPPHPTILTLIFYQIHPIHRKSLKRIKSFT